MKIIQFITCFLSLFVSAICMAKNESISPEAQFKKPNIVVVLADDIGLGDIGFYHRQRVGREPVVATPNLDKLAQAGMRFSDAHSPASLCAPTRFSMLTGSYTTRGSSIFGIWVPEGNAGIEPSSTTSARIAKEGGYHTAFIGKWGLGGSWNEQRHTHARLDKGAQYYGFDYAVELPQGIQDRPLAFYENKEWMKLQPNSMLTELNREQTRFGAKIGRNLSPDMIGDSNWDPAASGPILANKAVDYIERQTSEHPNEPFFLYYCSQAVHIPHTPPTELNGIKIAGETPDFYGDMILELDVQVGMLVDALKKVGVYENTLFIFTSDNGGLGKSQKMKEMGHLTSNGLRDVKGSIYEGGHRVPFFAVWPKVIKPGLESDSQIIAHDIVATISMLAKQKVDRSMIKDSLNLLPILTGNKQTDKRKFMVHQSKFGPFFAIREGDWKLVMSASKTNRSSIDLLKPVALFNLKENVSEAERENKIDDPDQTNRIDALLSIYKQYRKSGEATVVDL